MIQTLDGLRPFSLVEHQESHALMGWDIYANGLRFFAGKYVHINAIHHHGLVGTEQ